jgi:hypothetical protein
MRADTCLLCGHEGNDVRVALVEVEHPDRMVDVKVPANHRDGAVEMTVTVPERYYATPRCRDEMGCRERQAAAELAELSVPEPQPVSEQEPDVQEATSWL